jgi:osmoprotectant transport system substrate-binding protein
MRQTHRMLALGASLLMLLSVSAAGEGSTDRILTAQASAEPSSAPESAAPGGAQPSAAACQLPVDLPDGEAGDGTIRIGSAGFYESALMAEIYAQVLEANGLTVERRLNTGPRDVTWAALQAGTDINFMPEYMFSFLEQAVAPGAGLGSGDPAATHTCLAQELVPFDMTVLGYTPAVDTNAFVVRPDTAEQYGLDSIGDLAPIAGDLRWGLPPECATNPVCSGALEQYGIDFASLNVTPLGACGAEIATALAGGGVDVGELCSTQPDIALNGFVVLADDLGTQGADNLAPVVRNDVIRALTDVDLGAILNPISEAMTTEDLTALNVRVGVDQEDVDVVAADWLTEKGLLGGAPAGSPAASPSS